MPNVDLAAFAEQHFKNSSGFVPARLQAALALLERLREDPTLELGVHQKAGSSGLISHETLGARAHERLGLDVLNTTHGRRSNNLGAWGQKLLNLLDRAGFATLSNEERAAMLDDYQLAIAAIIRQILEQDPLQAHAKGRTVESFIREVLQLAEQRGRSGDVAQYLVGAKLMLRLGREIEVIGANRGDRRSRSDPNARTGDYEIENATIEVAVGLPDDKHLRQVVNILEQSDNEVWLLTRHDRVETWRNELTDLIEPAEMRRVVVTSVESFVGQNISEMGGFNAKKKVMKLAELITLYNERWIAAVGSPSLRIVAR